MIRCCNIVSAGTNRQHAGPQNAVKLDQETEDLHIETIGADVSVTIVVSVFANPVAHNYYPYSVIIILPLL